MLLAAHLGLVEDRFSLLQFADRTIIGGTQLKAGEYKVQWEGDGPNVELTILKGKSVVAKTPARRIGVNHAAVTNTTVTKANSDGSVSLSQIQFSGKKYAFEIGAEPAQAQTETAGSTK